jgi:cell division protein FtsB
MNTQTVSFITIALNAFALVWGAATIKTTVDHLQTTVTKLSTTLDVLVPTVARLEQQITDFESRLDAR